ncbi:catalase [Phormidesmis priestleyi ULC007]|uniref:Catalase n=1 Tax=Phormidesmis priestleyi ULC007 TaxID=1920490 RepID=A0A2T1DGP3_9CYAN|nr:catalase [Phormidesmis priestleyi]PSB19670.1 catalase [Phormidesmis priestleyi ULC007]PZO53554.1 MAG: catalase [Phormidesmis priestleyi]
MTEQSQPKKTAKTESLEQFQVDAGEQLTTNQGVVVDNTDNSLKAGNRGPSLKQDFHFQEKLTHFDRERIPERVVHARGAGAHGYFQVYESLAEYTKAQFLQDPAIQTPVFARFSTVGGSRGSADSVRDVRGFSVKFYTQEGNYDFVGNNIPVFFIQDAIKFPDIVHAIKPEPDNEIPQASTAHPSFWDFISLVPESTHMIMWLLSDRTLPRSFSRMQGFGVHTYRFVNAEGKSRFVKFHWKPILGVHSLAFDEAQKIAGKDPDFQRRDLWESIEQGDYPEFELGIQIIEEEDEHSFDFDILDSTKIIPEELVPVRPIGKMVLNRNPDNFFAETEQVAFQPSNVVPGIDFSDDPLLQGRLFSYHDTQLHRLGSPNFASLPINRPVCPFHNNQQDGRMQAEVKTSRVNYFPNSLGGGQPAPSETEGYVHYPERVEGHKVRERSPSFGEHFSQATLFWNSLSAAEKEHLVEAAHFEIGKVGDQGVRERMVDRLNHVDHELAKLVAIGVGVAAPTQPVTENHGQSSPAVSQEQLAVKTAKGRKVAILAADGVDAEQVTAIKQALTEAGAQAQIVAKFMGTIKDAKGKELKVDKTFLTSASVMFDAIYVPGGAQSIATLKANGDAIHFIDEAFRHCKAIAATGEGVELLKESSIQGITLSDRSPQNDQGVISAKIPSDLSKVAKSFVEAIAQHRFWTRTSKQKVPA